MFIFVKKKLVNFYYWTYTTIALIITYKVVPSALITYLLFIII